VCLTEPMTSGRATIGIDIGGTKTLLALLDERYQVLEEIKERTHPESGVRHFAGFLEKSITRLLRRAMRRHFGVRAVGVGCTGIVDRSKNRMKSCPNIPFLEQFPLRTKIESWTKTPVGLFNDVVAGLHAEHAMGAARGCHNVMAIFIGTGVGCALVLNDRLYTGSNGYAADLGHTLLSSIERLSGSDYAGILDDVVSRTAIAAGAAKLALKQWAPSLGRTVGTDLAQIRASDIAAAIDAGDRSIENLVRSRARLLGIVLANSIHLLNPDAIILGGGMTDAMPRLILQEVRKGIRMHATPALTKHLKVAVTHLGGHSIPIGAAKLAVDRSRNPLHD
jgi:glucokinase